MEEFRKEKWKPSLQAIKLSFKKQEELAESIAGLIFACTSPASCAQFTKLKNTDFLRAASSMTLTNRSRLYWMWLVLYSTLFQYFPTMIDSFARIPVYADMRPAAC